MPKRGSVPEAPTWEDVKGREAHRLVQFARPWACLLALLVAGAVLHKGWPYPVMASGIMTLALGVSGLLRHFTHRRTSVAARWMAPATVLSGAGWLVSADLAGLTRTVLGFWAIGGAAVCLVWNAWLAVRESDAGDVGHSLLKGAERAGIHGLKAKIISLEPGKAEAVLVPRPGEYIAEDLMKQAPYIEAGAGLPVGALTMAPVPERRGPVKVKVSDPRLIDAPVPWPGTSIPSGGSIADPIVPGIWQDGEPVKYVVVGHHLQVMGCTGSGKALKLDTPVPTPSGWSTMGELRDGDLVFDEAGQPCRVVRAWPVRYGRPCYEVEFSDGSVITADAEHLWLVDTRASRRSARKASRPDLRPRKTLAHRPQEYRRKKPQVLTTEQLLPGLMHGEYRNYSVRVAAPLQCPEAVLLVPPYTLGAWLGDGTSSDGSVTAVDREIIDYIAADGFSAHVFPCRDVEGKAPTYQVDGLNTLLRRLGVRKPEGSKHIPVAYQRASEAQRRALLAGLLDTDGHCTPSGTVEFCNTNEQLARDVLRLVSGLGYKAMLRSKIARLYGRDCGIVWTVSFTPSDKVFRLPRKLARQVTSVRATAAHRYVTEIRPVPSVPVRCITVDSPSSLYLVGETCIPTHNTQSQARNETAETVTRYDAGVLGWDISKMNQFLGAMRPCLHSLAITPPEALDAFDCVFGMAKDRMQYLAERGLEKWEKGCGLTHWTCQLEECPDLIDMLAQAKMDDRFESAVKVFRSAGMRWVLSLQRSDYTQMPTILRSQLDYACFGCKSDQDEGFGLSPRQKQRECEPSLWGDRYPGKAFLDSKSIPDDRIAMPMRWYDWGRTDKLIAAHARQYPAAAKRIDPISEKWLGRLYSARPSVAPSDAPVRAGSASDRPSGRESIRLVRPDERAPGQQASQQASQQGDRTVYPKQLPDDHDPDTWTAPGPDDLAGDGEPDKAFTVPDTPVGAWEWGGPAAASAELSAEEADAAFMEFIHECRAKGQYTITLEDLLPVRERAGKSRPWLYFIIDKKVASGVLRKSGKASWTISRVA